jgi:hypothetical protein
MLRACAAWFEGGGFELSATPYMLVCALSAMRYPIAPWKLRAIRRQRWRWMATRRLLDVIDS